MQASLPIHIKWCLTYKKLSYICNYETSLIIMIKLIKHIDGFVVGSLIPKLGVKIYLNNLKALMKYYNQLSMHLFITYLIILFSHRL